MKTVCVGWILAIFLFSQPCLFAQAVPQHHRAEKISEHAHLLLSSHWSVGRRPYSLATKNTYCVLQTSPPAKSKTLK